MFEYKGIKIFWLGHAGFKIKNSKTIYIDPYNIKPSEPADLILITHEHFDHFSTKDIKKVLNRSIAVCPEFCKLEFLRLGVKEILTVEPGKKYSVGETEIEAFPAYNVNKFRSPGQVYHPKIDKKVGYIITLNGVKIYHAGDTDFIPEMKNLKDIDIALLPVGGTYTMTAEEAAQAANTINPKVAIPMHYGEIVGSEKDAEKFKTLAKCKVEILKKE
jgi:L-ascorbate metabolism protein UlaG (beta-lactamase superfamily)